MPRFSWNLILRNKLKFIAIALPIFLWLGFGYYIVRSKANPHFWEILLLAILLPVSMGLLGLLISDWYKRWLKNKVLPLRPKELVLLAWLVPSIFGIIGVFIYTTNQPKTMSIDLPVTYAINCQTNLPPRTLRFSSQEASFGYASMVSILDEYQSASPRNAELVGGFSNVGPVNTSDDAVTLINDLTTYLVPYLLSNLVSTSEISSEIYRGKQARWLAFPDISIRGDKKKLEQIGGEFKENLFYGYYGRHPTSESGIRLPRNTELSVTRDDWLTSRLRIENDYVTITIGTDIDIFHSGNIAVLDPEFFHQPWQFGQSEFSEVVETEMKSRYYIIQAIIRFDAEFDRFRHGFLSMRHHEQWTRDLFGLLERRLAWGLMTYTDLSDLSLAEVTKLKGCS